MAVLGGKKTSGTAPAGVPGTSPSDSPGWQTKVTPWWAFELMMHMNSPRVAITADPYDRWLGILVDFFSYDRVGDGLRNAVVKTADVLERAGGRTPQTLLRRHQLDSP